MKKIFDLEKELNESQLDFHYLTSPKILQKKFLSLQAVNIIILAFQKFI